MKNAELLTCDENYNIEASGHLHQLDCTCTFKFLVQAFSVGQRQLKI